jgi:hypothetical protein
MDVLVSFPVLAYVSSLYDLEFYKSGSDFYGNSGGMRNAKLEEWS